MDETLCRFSESVTIERLGGNLVWSPAPHELPGVGCSLEFSLTPSNWQE